MDTYEKEAERLVGLLRRLVKLSGRSMRSLEAELGLGSSVLGKILSGAIRPQLAHLLMICDAVGVSPVEFFLMAYPNRRAKSPLVQEILEAEGQAGRTVPDDLDERVRESLLRLLDELRVKRA